MKSSPEGRAQSSAVGAALRKRFVGRLAVGLDDPHRTRDCLLVRADVPSVQNTRERRDTKQSNKKSKSNKKHWGTLDWVWEREKCAQAKRKQSVR